MKTITMLTEKSTKPVYTISTAARLLGISIPTLRMYENEGLIIPFKKSSSHRLYSDLDLERIKCLRHAINGGKMGIESIRRMLSLIPCWAIMSCTEKDRKKCEAFANYEKPCWMHNHKDNVCTGRDCRECEVYNSFSDCGSLKEKLKELIPPKN
jgi:MerR family transcriptional regulator/heat shock protein HspR